MKALPWIVVLCGLGCGGDDPKQPDEPPTESSTPAGEVTAQIHPNMGSIVVVSWDQALPADVLVEYSFDEGVWLSSPTETQQSGPQEVLLLGVPFDAEVAYRLVVDGVAAAQAAIRTGSLPDGAPQPEVLSSDSSKHDPDANWFLSCLDADGSDWRPWTFVVDRKGRVVWALKTTGANWTMHPQVSYDGAAFLIDRNSYWINFDGGAASYVERVSIDGTVQKTYETPGLHHAFTELDDGSVAWGAAPSRYGGDETLDILRPDGSIDSIWSCFDWLDSASAPRDCGSNTLRWNEPTNTFLFSMYTTDTVIEVDATTGSTVRWFGHVPGAWDFSPAQSAFWWQHGVHYTDSGTLLVSTKNEEDGNETLVREYELDPASETLVQVWEFGSGEGLYGATMGEAERLGGGNTLHNYGSEARLREVTPNGEVVWDIEWPGADDEIGRSTPLADLYDFLP